MNKQNTINEIDEEKMEYTNNFARKQTQKVGTRKKKKKSTNLSLITFH